jgi:hypothetical protein
MGIYEKLLKIQTELKCNKSQYNSFGKYNYRSCEDILEAAKPLLVKHKLSMQISDELEQVGDRYYIKATATLLDIEDNSTMSNTAYAREDLDKKGMDGSQITGTASSYARKYALNGLFLIDDTKDSDTNEYHTQNDETDHLKLMQEFNELADETGLNREALYEKLGVKSNSEIPSKKLQELIDSMKKKKGSK